MHSRFAEEDPLLRAIAALREDVDRMIDEQILRIDAVEDPARVPATAEAVGPARPVPPDRARLPAGARERPSPGPAESVTTEPAEDDPRRRLDALARLLDDRLRRAQDHPAADRPEAPSKG